MPLRRMNAMTRSIASADSISERNSIPKAWFPRRVGEQRGVEKWDERVADDVGAAVGAAPEDGVQHGGKINRGSHLVEAHQLTETVKQPTSNGEPDSNPVAVADVGQSAFDLTAQMPRDAVRGFGGPEGALLDREPT